MNKVYFCIQSLLLLFLSLFIKRKQNRIVFGSWSGELFIDNSKYLALYVKEHHPQYKVFWVGTKKIKKEVINSGFIYLKKDSFLSNIKMLTCKYFFFSQMAGADISHSNVYRNAITCYLHHGMPIKKWGDDAVGYTPHVKNGLLSFYQRLTGSSIKYDFFATSSRLHDLSNCTSLRFRGCEDSKNLKCGTPRNDFLIKIDQQKKEEIIKKYKESLNLFGFKRIILYLPTYRRKSNNIFSFANLSLDEMTALNNILLQFDAVIIEKSHFAEKNLIRKDNLNKNVLIVGNDVNVQELYLFSDALITDYSGAFLDYLFLNKPIIHFAYDYDYYKNVDSGLYYEIDDFSAGPIASDFSILLNCLKDVLSGNDLFAFKRDYVKAKYMTYEDGNASQNIFEKVVLNNGKNK